jgi:hypothetical protein
LRAGWGWRSKRGLRSACFEEMGRKRIDDERFTVVLEHFSPVEQQVHRPDFAVIRDLDGDVAVPEGVGVLEQVWPGEDPIQDEEDLVAGLGSGTADAHGACLYAGLELCTSLVQGRLPCSESELKGLKCWPRTRIFISTLFSSINLYDQL